MKFERFLGHLKKQKEENNRNSSENLNCIRVVCQHNRHSDNQNFAPEDYKLPEIVLLLVTIEKIGKHELCVKLGSSVST
jgi:hypothetical protein